MINHIRWYIFTIFILTTTVLTAQSGLNVQFMPQEITAQFYQPAFLSQHEFELISVGVGGEYGLGANTLTVSRLFMNDNFISQEEKDVLVGQMTDDNRLRLSFGQSAMINFQAFGQRFSLSYQDRQAGYFRINAPHTAGLVLYGNAPYGGQTLNDENITLRNYRYREIGLGSAWNIGSLSLGIRLKALLGGNANLTQDLSYSFFTAEDGSEINLNADYQIANAGTGFGLGADLGLIFQPNDKFTLQAAVRDIGFINWDATEFNNSVSINYSGLDLNQFINTEFTSGGQLFSLDTLQELFFPDSSTGILRMPLPGNASFSASYSFGKGNAIYGGIHAGFSQYSPWTPAPLIMLGYAHQFGKVLTLGVNGYAGGLEGYGAGAWARGEFLMADRYVVSAFLSADNATGYIVPENANGLSLQGGLTFRLVAPSTESQAQ